MIKPLPHGVSPEDPRWAIQFLEMVHGLVECDTRSVLIRHLTGWSRPRITQLYQVIRQKKPASGTAVQQEAKFFAVPSKHTSITWTVQGAIFLECYSRMMRLVEYQQHPGWLLLHSYRTYLAQTEVLLAQYPTTQRLTINQAYGLLSKVGHLNERFTSMAELRRKLCPECGFRHLVPTDRELDGQTCPVCAADRAAQRRADHSSARAGARTSLDCVSGAVG